MYNYIFLIHSAHDFDFFINLSRKRKPILIITSSIMYNAVKYNFPDCDIIKIFYFDLTIKKIKKNHLLLKNIFKLSVNFLLIIYNFFILRKKFKKIVLIFNHQYSLQIMQALGIANFFKFKIIRKIIVSSQSHKDQVVNFYDIRTKIYEFFLLNKIIFFKTFLNDDIRCSTNIKYKKIFSIKSNVFDYYEFIKKKYKNIINKKIILLFDYPLGRIENQPDFLLRVDIKKTCNNLITFIQKKRKEDYLVCIKKRPDHYYFDGAYFCDLIKDKNIYELNRYIPAEYLLKFFKHYYFISYSQTSATQKKYIKIKKKNVSNSLSSFIKFID